MGVDLIREIGTEERRGEEADAQPNVGKTTDADTEPIDASKDVYRPH